MDDDERIRELHDLLTDLCGDQADAATAPRIEALVLPSAAARQYYVDFIELQAMLRVACREQGDEIAAESTNDVVLVDMPAAAERGWYGHFAQGMHDMGVFFARPAAFSIALAGLTLACAVLAMTLIQLSNESPIGPRRDEAVAEAKSVARIVDTIDAVWAESKNGSMNDGRRLMAGDRLELRQGQAKVFFDAGTSVVLTAPVELTLQGANQARLHHGTLAAAVLRQAHGFTVETPAGDVVDRGTEFAVHVDRDRTSTVQVFLGAVEMRTIDGEGGKTHYLSAGQSICISPSGEKSDAPTVDLDLAPCNRFDASKVGLLFRDQFHAANDCPLADSTAADRLQGQSGLLVGARGVRYQATGEANVAASIGGREGVLKLARGAIVAPRIGVSARQIERAGGFTVEIKFTTSLRNDQNMNRWLGLRLLADKNDRLAATNRYSGPCYHLRPNGQFSFHEAGDRQNSKANRPTFSDEARRWRKIRVEAIVTALDGKTPVRIRAFADDSPTPFHEYDTERGYHGADFAIEYQARDEEVVALVDEASFSLLRHSPDGTTGEAKSLKTP